jgi:dolichyl-phosphate beta-glucosyltransferase
MKMSIQLSRYIITGGLTTFIDLLFLYLFKEFAGFSVLFSSGLAFLLAVIFSFIVNSSWTFEVKKTFNPDQFLRFFFVSVIGLGLTLLFMNILTQQFLIYYLYAKIITSILVLAWNFLANSLWTFSDTEKKIGEYDEMKYISIPENLKYQYEVSLVIPAYNEEKSILKTLKLAYEYFKNKNISFELIIVNDGGKDRTVEICQKFVRDQKLENSTQIIDIKINQGKGKAVQCGFLQANGKYILFADADGATPFNEYENLKQVLEEKACHFVIGSRYKHKNLVKEKQPFYRIFFSRVINFCLQIFLINGVSDTQCGFKLFHNEVGKNIFALQRIKRFAFDVEILVLAEKFQYKYKEVSVQWYDQDGSTFSQFGDGFHTIWDFLRIKYFSTFGGYKIIK